MIWNLRGQKIVCGGLKTEFEGQNNDFGGTKRHNYIPLVPPNSFGPPPMGAVGIDFKDRSGDCHWNRSEVCSFGDLLDKLVDEAKKRLRKCGAGHPHLLWRDQEHIDMDNWLTYLIGRKQETMRG